MFFKSITGTFNVSGILRDRIIMGITVAAHHADVADVTIAFAGALTCAASLQETYISMIKIRS